MRWDELAPLQPRKCTLTMVIMVRSIFHHRHVETM